MKKVMKNGEGAITRDAGRGTKRRLKDLVTSEMRISMFRNGLAKGIGRKTDMEIIQLLI